MSRRSPVQPLPAASPPALSPALLRRLASLLAAALLSAAAMVAVIEPYFFNAPPGDYETRQGDILLSDGKWEAARERFDAALRAAPEHRGAWMGKAIAWLQAGHPAEAEVAFTHLIQLLARQDGSDDPTGRAVLAGALANRGILYDREGRFEAALADYQQALAVDAQAVDGPGMIDRILYGNTQPSTVAQRAAYLERQLALPEGERLLHVPALDARERMHKP